MDVDWLVKLTDEIAENQAEVIDNWMLPIVRELMNMPLTFKSRKEILFAADWMRRNGYSLHYQKNYSSNTTDYKLVRTVRNGKGEPVSETISELKLNLKFGVK